MIRYMRIMVLPLVMAAIGCGPPDVYQTEGVITKDGKPVPFLQITFQPDMLDSTRPPFAIADKDGKFEMKTGRERGCPPGTYTIHIEDPAAADGDTTPQKSDDFYEDYMYVIERYSPYNSELKYEADAHRSDFELKLDTAEYTKPKVPYRQTQNTTDVE